MHTEIDDPVFTPDVQALCRHLHLWIAGELVSLMRAEPSSRQGGLLLSALVWGEKYINRFLSLTAPSLLGGSNGNALRDSGSLIILFTDLSGFDKLRTWAESTWGKHGIRVNLFILPPPLMDALMAGGENGIWDAQKVFPTLGTTQTLALKLAAWNRMAYHSLFPDHYYSRDYFKNLLRLGKSHKAIVQSSISADYETTASILHARPEGIPARELGAIGFRNLHLQSQGNLMNRGKELLGLPMSFQCIWQGRDRLYLHCPHTNPVYLAPELCTVAPVRYFSPIDCNLPYICGEEFYFPTVEDDMTFIELSDGSKESSTEKLSPEVHAAICWSHVKFRDEYIRWFMTRCEVPIDQQPEWMEPDEIAASHADIVDGLLHYKSIVEARIREYDKAA